MNHSANETYDCLIVGAGLVGSSLALALANSGIRLALIDQHPLFLDSHDSSDYRNLVLSLSSQRILKAFGLWQRLADLSSRIDTVHVTEQGACQRVVMRAEQCDLDALAYSVPAPLLAQQLHRMIDADGGHDVLCPAAIHKLQQDSDSVEVTIEHEQQTKTLRAKLLVLATGSDCSFRDQLGFSTVRKDYGQQAIVANVTTERLYPHTAFERFSSQGPFALLPAGDHYGMVCVVKDQQADHFLSMDDAAFLDYVQQRGGRRLGRFLRIGQRKSYPLSYVQVKQAYLNRVLLLGNSAHTIHPNGAQGFNLALRDVAQLIENLRQAYKQEQDLGSQQLLAAYEQQRHQDQQRVMTFSDQLAGMFYNDLMVKRTLRRSAMFATEYFWPVKKALMHRAMGIYGQQADMAKQSLL